ncbi:MAG: hypothetical protein HYW91_01015 [Candidatus Sungbacteria bacterium]|nr:hypothetical protein [Candidatus Sungbacteria bacterium]
MPEQKESAPENGRKEKFRNKFWEKVRGAKEAKRLWELQGSPPTGTENPSAYDHDLIDINPDHVAEYEPAIDIWEKIEAETATREDLLGFNTRLNQELHLFPPNVQKSLGAFQAMLGNKASYLNKRSSEEHRKKMFPQK